MDNEVIFKLRLDMGDAEKKIDAFKNKLHELGKGLSFSGLMNAFTSLLTPIKAVTAALFDLISAGAQLTKQFVTNAIDAFHDYETELALVGKTTGMAGKELSDFGEKIREVSKPIGSLNAGNLLQVAQVAGQLGINKQDIADFAVEVGIGAIALDKFGGSTEKLATHLAKTQTIFKLLPEATKNQLSALDALSKSTAANELEISNFNLAMGQFNTQLRLSFQESSALGALFISSGQQAGKAATQYGSAFKQLSTTAKGLSGAIAIMQSGADGGAAAIAQLELIVGRSRDSFDSLGTMIKYALGEDAFATMNLLAREFGNIENTTENIQQGVDQNTLGIQAFGAIGLKSMSILAEGMTAAKDAQNNFESILNKSTLSFESGQSHIDSYNAAVNKTSEAGKVLMSIWNAILITFGKPMAEALAALINKIIPLVDEFEVWSRTNEGFQRGLTAIITALQTIAGGIIDAITDQFRTWITYIDEHGEQLWKELKAGAISFLDTIKTVGKEIQAWVAQLDFKDILTFFTTTLPGAIKKAASVIQILVTAIGHVGTAIGYGQVAWETFTATIQDLRELTQPIFDAFVAIVYKLGDVFKAVGKSIGNSIQIAIDIGTIFWNLISWEWSEAIENIKKLFTDLGGTVKSVFSAMTSVIKGTIGIVGDLVKGLWETIGAVKDLALEAFEKSTFPDMTEWVNTTTVSVGSLTQAITKTTTALEHVAASDLSALQDQLALVNAQISQRNTLLNSSVGLNRQLAGDEGMSKEKWDLMLAINKAHSQQLSSVVPVAPSQTASFAPVSAAQATSAPSLGGTAQPVTLQANILLDDLVIGKVVKKFTEIQQTQADRITYG